MPIINNYNTQLIFGVLDISIQSGYEKHKTPHTFNIKPGTHMSTWFICV